MTSKNSWFSHQLLWDTFKKNLWLAALAFLAFFFSLPVATALLLQNFKRWTVDGTVNNLYARTVEKVMMPFSLAHPFVMFFIILGAVVAAATVFFYLHSRQRTDFYHSLPLSRTKLFTINYGAGALLVLLPYLINIVLTLIVVAANGFFGYLNGLEVLINVCHHLLFFFAIYSLTVLSATLTGNWVTNLLLAGTMMFILPAFAGIWELAMSTFYATYYSINDLAVKLACYLSPVTRYITADGDVASLPIQAWEYGIWVLVTILLVAAALLLYRKRSSESAGHAIAFRWAKPIIKYPLIFMFTLLVGILFHAIGNNGYYNQWSGWMIFGFVCGALIVSRIIEIVFEFDFKAIKKNWKGLLIFTVLFAGFISIPMFDLTGYDSYIPELSEIKEVSLDVYGVDPVYQNDDYVYRHYYGGNYQEGYLKTTLLQDPDNIQRALEIAQISLQDSQLRDESMAYDEGVNLTSATIVYTLSSGRRVGRRYAMVDQSLLTELFSQIASTQEYKENRYSLFYLPSDNLVFARLNVFANDRSRGFSYRDFTKEQQQALVEAMRQDILAADSSKLQQTLPLGIIEFGVYSKNIASLLSISNEESDQYLQNSITYPLYPSFTNTWAMLTELAGVDQTAFHLQPSQIEKIEVVTYAETTVDQVAYEYGGPYATIAKEVREDEQVETVTDPAQIAQLMVGAYPESAFYYSNYYRWRQDTGNYLRVFHSNGNYTNYYYARTDSSTSNTN